MQMLQNTERAFVTLNRKTKEKNSLGKCNSENCAGQEFPGTQCRLSESEN